VRLGAPSEHLRRGLRRRAPAKAAPQAAARGRCRNVVRAASELKIHGYFPTSETIARVCVQLSKALSRLPMRWELSLSPCDHGRGLVKEVSLV
jgi:hypothetical protein